MILKLRDDQELYYEIHGNLEANKTIVFINGLTQSTLAWNGVFPLLATKYRIILFDLVLQGKSGKPEKFRTYDEHAFDVVELIANTRKGSVVIVGISYGGAVAQHVLVNHSEKVSGAVLISTFAHKTAHFNAIGESWANALTCGGYSLLFDVMLPYVLSENYFEKPLIPVDEMKKLRLQLDLRKEDIYKLMQATDERPDYREELNKIGAPVLIIHGKKDLLFPVYIAEEIKNNIKNSKLELIENAGHTLNLEAMSQLAEMIDSFSETV